VRTTIPFRGRLALAPLLATPVALLAAASAQARDPVVAERSLGDDLPSFLAPSDPGDAPQPAPADPAGVLHLRDALAAALLGNPQLAARSYEVRAREAAVLQAGRWPNPVLSTEVEDVFGNGELSGVGRSETTIQLGQLVELGGKRAARVRLASARQRLAGFDYEAQRIAVFTRTVDAFVEVLAAQERMRLADDALALARSVYGVAERRVAAGLASPAEEIRAGVAVDTAAVEREHADHELENARTALAESWGGTEARFDRAEGDLADVPAPPELDELGRRALASPQLARWAAELERRDAELERARSRRIPDVTLAAGPRYMAGSDETSLVFGVSLPLPLWNRNGDAIAEARHRRARAARERRAAEVRVATAVRTARTSLRASTEEARMLEERVLPGIERALAVLRRGYERGRHSQLELLEAAQARLSAREQRLRALVEAHHAALRLERLTGAPLEDRP
jgi:cobalt-zinc-cadmium efflux system outer membrane protein